eukprot:6019424-Amphidinium_carterae.1
MRGDRQVLEAALGNSAGNIHDVLTSVGLQGHFAIKASFFGGRSTYCIVGPGTSARTFKAHVLPELVAQLDLSSEETPSETDYDFILGLSILMDDMPVESWPGILNDALNDIIL